MSFDANVTVGGGHFVDTGSGYAQQCDIPTADYSGHIVVGGGHMDNPAQLHLANRVDNAYDRTSVSDSSPVATLIWELPKIMVNSVKVAIDIKRASPNEEASVILCGKHKHTKSEHQDKAQEHLKESGKSLALAWASKMAGDDQAALEHGLDSVLKFFQSEYHQWGTMFAPKEHK